MSEPSHNDICVIWTNKLFSVNVDTIKDDLKLQRPL